jgi:hypothetical protein
MRRIISCLMKISTVCWAIMAGMAFYWWFLDNPDPVKINSVSILHDGPIHAGDVVTLHVDICQVRPGVPGTGVRMIKGPQDGYLRFMSENYIFPATGCTKHDRPIKLPADLETGKHSYIFQGLYQINPIKTAVFTQPPIAFEIVP